MENFEARQLVWAKTDSKFWPGRDDVDLGLQEGFVWIFWFGDHRVSQVKATSLLNFGQFFAKFCCKNFNEKRNKWTAGVVEAIKLFGQPETLDWDEKTSISWALNGFKTSKTSKTLKILPSFVRENIATINLNLTKQTNVETVKVIVEEDLEKICLSCRRKLIFDEHPLFYGKICQNCQEKLVKTMFFLGNDGIQFCCAICGNFGKMIVCSVTNCGRSFCERCFDILEVQISKIIRKKLWKCFVCSKSGEGFLRCRPDWTDRVHKLFNFSYLHEIPKMTAEKPKLTVLSLFDGISSGSVALSKLNMSVKVYYASEIDDCAMKVSKCHFDNIVHIGDVFKINEHILTEIGPVDLILAGSPCNDLSLANPTRKGLYESTGSGNLFFQFFRILMMMKQLHNRPFFWLYENVASMTLKSKDTISRFLDCQPVRVNSVWTSAQRRERLFWGNCPSLCCDLENEGPQLQDFLGAHRRAACRDIQTVTTKSNSLLQGIEHRYPVFDTVKNCEDVLTTEEIERIFGFDSDYTNVVGLSATVRQTLVGKAWSIPVICQLLQFLKYFYQQEEC